MLLNYLPHVFTHLDSQKHSESTKMLIYIIVKPDPNLTKDQAKLCQTYRKNRPQLSSHVHSFALHGFGYLRWTAVQSHYIENSRNAQFISFNCTPFGVAWWNPAPPTSFQPETWRTPLCSVSSPCVLLARGALSDVPRWRIYCLES